MSDLRCNGCERNKGERGQQGSRHPRLQLEGKIQSFQSHSFALVSLRIGAGDNVRSLNAEINAELHRNPIGR
jgi:hypothetical protein